MSLTDDLKNGVLPDGNYFCKTALGNIDVFNCVDGNLFTFADENQVYFVDEILAICDYKEVQRLKKGWELYSHETVITKQLRQLLKECKIFFEEENPKDFTVLSERMEYLLTKINEVMK